MIDSIISNPDNKFAPYQHMASAIIGLICNRGVCQPQDLLAFGFTREETLERWHMAHAMANVELKLMEKCHLHLGCISESI